MDTGPLARRCLASTPGTDPAAPLLVKVEAGREHLAEGESFRNLARLITTMAHPGPVYALEVGYEQPYAYVAEEVVTGETLDRRTAAHGALALPEAAPILAQVIAASEFAHDRDFTHLYLQAEQRLRA